MAAGCLLSSSLAFKLCINESSIRMYLRRILCEKETKMMMAAVIRRMTQRVKRKYLDKLRMTKKQARKMRKSVQPMMAMRLA